MWIFVCRAAIFILNCKKYCSEKINHLLYHSASYNVEQIGCDFNEIYRQLIPLINLVSIWKVLLTLSVFFFNIVLKFLNIKFCVKNSFFLLQILFPFFLIPFKKMALKFERVQMYSASVYILNMHVHTYTIFIYIYNICIHKYKFKFIW